jgi:hypothetical protein
MSETQIRELFARHADSAEPPLPPRFVAQSVDSGRRRLRRRRAARAAVGGVAVVAALAMGVTAIVAVGADSPPEAVPGPETVAAAPTDAVTLLGQISRAASQRRVDIRDDQFIYEKRRFVTKFPTPISGRTEVAGISESWDSVDGTKPGLAVFPDKLGRLSTGETPAVAQPSLLEPTYKYLTTLPADPDALLERVRALVDTRPGKPDSTVDRDQETFDLIGQVVNNTMVPPDLGAALYRAAAKIPGVTVIADVTDTAGRSGIAVSRTSTVGVHSATWIFDRDTYGFLGASSNHSGAPTADSTFAVLTRVVVDRVRQTP